MAMFDLSFPITRNGSVWLHLDRIGSKFQNS